MRKRWDDSEKRKAMALYDEGQSTPAIALELRRGTESVREHLKAQGVTLRPRGRRKSP